MTQHHFSVIATWRGGLTSGGQLKCPTASVSISAPSALGGSGLGVNPEELLLGAAASCFLITAAAIIEKRALPVAALSVASSGVLSTDSGLTFKEIVHMPAVELHPDATMAERQQTLEALHKAEALCLVAQAMRGNVTVTMVEPSGLVKSS